MPKSLVLLIAAAVMAAAGCAATVVEAKPKKPTTGVCSIRGGYAPCDWVEKCLLEGGTPERTAWGLRCKKPKPKAIY